jgi:RecB family endonuclease NucS
MQDESPFVAFVDASVEYSGRASSLLARGNYLLIYKDDKSFSVHGSTNIGPRNYQGKATKLTFSGDTLLATNKKEIIKVRIYSTIWTQPAACWSSAPVVVTKTEKELVDRIVADPLTYLGFVPDSIRTEVPTTNGPVDILATKDDVDHVIEVKRKIISTNNAVQLRKYLECWGTKKVIGYVAAPGISIGASKYCAKHLLHYIPVTWSTTQDQSSRPA